MKLDKSIDHIFQGLNLKKLFDSFYLKISIFLTNRITRMEISIKRKFRIFLYVKVIFLFGYFNLLTEHIVETENYN